VGEAHRNGNANPSQALKGRNDQAKGVTLESGPSSPKQDNFTPSGLSSLAWLRFLQPYLPFGLGLAFEAIHHLCLELGISRGPRK